MWKSQIIKNAIFQTGAKDHVYSTIPSHLLQPNDLGIEKQDRHEGVMAHAYHPNTLKVEARRLRILDQLGLQRKTWSWGQGDGPVGKAFATYM